MAAKTSPPWHQGTTTLVAVTLTPYTVIVASTPHWERGRGVIRTGWVRQARTLGLSHDAEWRLVRRALDATMPPSRR